MFTYHLLTAVRVLVVWKLLCTALKLFAKYSCVELPSSVATAHAPNVHREVQTGAQNGRDNNSLTYTPHVPQATAEPSTLEMSSTAALLYSADLLFVGDHPKLPILDAELI